MATYTVAAGKTALHAKTTVASVEDIVNFADDIPNVEVFVESGAGVYFTTNRSAATLPGSDTNGSMTTYVPAGSSVQTEVWTDAGSQIRLISAGAAVYHVTRI